MSPAGGRNSVVALVALVGLGALAAGASGCVANETAAMSTGVAVSGPPPAPIPEERPAPPAGRAAWVTGYWHWTGVHYAWIPGHWEQPPAGATWAAPQYVNREGSYFYQPGGWQGRPPERANAIR